MKGQHEPQLRQRAYIASRDAADHEPGSNGRLEIRVDGFAQGMDVLQPEAEAEPRVVQQLISGGHVREVARPSGLYPSGGRGRVRLAQGLCVAGRAARILDPHVGTPRRVGARRPEHERRGRSAGGDQRAGCGVALEQLGDLSPRGVVLLIDRVQRGHRESMAPVPLCQQPRGVVKRVGGELAHLVSGHASAS